MSKFTKKYLDKLNSSQKKAVINTEGSCLVLAGAGSGKTRVLTYRLLHLLIEKKAFPNQILAVTFTNKASHEMNQHLVRKIHMTIRSVNKVKAHGNESIIHGNGCGPNPLNRPIP